MHASYGDLCKCPGHKTPPFGDHSRVQHIRACCLPCKRCGIPIAVDHLSDCHLSKEKILSK